MKKLFRLIIMIIMGLVINSCYYDAFPEEEIIIDDPDTPIEDVSYQSDIIPLWAQCVGCHNGNEPPDLRDNVSYNELLNGFVVPGDAESSTLYKTLLGVGAPLMPPGSQWPDSKINLVKDWINQGALNN